MKKLSLQILLGSTRPNRFGDKAAQWILDIAKKNERFDVQLVDLRDWPLPMYEEKVSLAYANAEGDLAKKWASMVAKADAYIIVTPEYNHGYPAVLKNALDYAYPEWNDKPVGFVSYGSVGGARSVEQLRQVAVELHMASVRQAVHIVAPWLLVESSGALKDGALQVHEEAAGTMLGQIIRWGDAFASMRPQK